VLVAERVLTRRSTLLLPEVLPGCRAGSVMRGHRAFDVDSAALSLTELSRRSGVAKATTHRLANALVEWGVLERAGTKYRLDLRLFELGQLVPTQRISRDAALPYLQELHAVTAATVHFAIRDGLDVLYIDKISGHGAVGTPSDRARLVGRRRRIIARISPGR
jgi:DNA-binding IclR family transcriptional regulator